MWSWTYRVCEAISWLLDQLACWLVVLQLVTLAPRLAHMFSCMFDMPWRTDLHGAEVPQPFLPTHVALLLALAAVPWLLGTSLLHDLFVPPTPLSSLVG